MNKNQFKILSATGLFVLTNLLSSCMTNSNSTVSPDKCVAKVIIGKTFNVRHNTGQVYNGTQPVEDVSIGEVKFLDGRRYTSTVKIWGDTGSYRIVLFNSCEKNVWLQLLQNNKPIYTYATYEEQVEGNGSVWFRLKNTDNKNDSLKLGTKSN